MTATISTARWIIDPDVDAKTTMRRMSKLVHHALLDPAIVRYSNEIISQARPRDYAAQIAAVRTFGETYFRFVTNPIGEQLIRDPESMIACIEQQGYVQGACDDAAVLMATFCMANGLPCQFRALAFSHGEDRTAPYSHVIADAYDGAAWEPLDITKPLDMLRLPDVARTLTVEV